MHAHNLYTINNLYTIDNVNLYKLYINKNILFLYVYIQFVYNVHAIYIQLTIVTVYKLYINIYTMCIQYIYN